MLIDRGAMINLFPYSLFKKMGKSDEKLIKTNITVNGVGASKSIEPKGVASVELTAVSKTMATTFFVIEVQGNYSVILGWDWIHANRCVPSTLHQFFIQWVGDDVEVVYADTLACVAIVDSYLGTHDDVKCLTGLDLSYYDFLCVSKDGSVPVHVKPIENRLTHTCF
jgi:hypothetical protein